METLNPHTTVGERHYDEAAIARFVNLMNWQEGQTVTSWAERLMDSLIAYIDGFQAALYLYNEAGDELEFSAGYGIGEIGAERRCIRMNDTLLGQAAAKREPILQNNVSDTEFLPASATVGLRVASMYYLPIIYNDMLCGAMEIIFGRPVTDEQIDFLNRLLPNIGANIILLRNAQALETSNDELAKKNKSINDSINYARHIQESMLPSVELIRRELPEFFAFFRPRDIVSGDFYWYSTYIEKLIITAVDCTGHGVPGAFMTLVAESCLNQTINIDQVTEPDEILNRLHELVRQYLKQDITGNRDGMDMSLCVIDKFEGTLEFAGAHNPLVYIKNDEVFSIGGDRQAIGGKRIRRKGRSTDFTRHTVRIDTPTQVYLFSDGFQDQFGGADDNPLGRKYKIKNLREFLLSIHKDAPGLQEQKLADEFDRWRNGRPQTDDVVVLGFRLAPEGE